MENIHEYLKRSHAWYATWHNNPHSDAVSWAAFILVSIFFTFGLLSVIEHEVLDVENVTQVSLVQMATSTGRGSSSDDPVIGRLLGANNKALSHANGHALSAPGLQNMALANLKQSLTERQATIRELALTHPKEVRRFVFDEAAREAIPADARDLVEQPVRQEGTFRMVIAENFEGEETYTEYFLEQDGKRYRLALTEDEVMDIEPETSVSVVGVDLGNDVIVPTELLEPSEDEGEGLVLGASTIKKVAIVALNFRNNTAQPITPDTIRQRAFTNTNSVNAYYKEISQGTWELQGRDRVDGDVYGWVTIDMDTGGCNYSGWASAAGEKLAASGVNLTGYTNIQYIFPGSGAGCGWSGLAYVGGSTSWVVAESFNTHVSGHELGHNFGFRHAATPGSEYGDNQDIMGGAARHTNNYNKSRYWIPSSQFLTVTQPGTYTLEPTETVSSGIKAIRIKRPYLPNINSADSHYMLEFRTPHGVFDAYAATDPYVNGVTVREVAGNYPGGGSKTYRLTTIPKGGTFTDAEGGISISVSDVSTSGAVVNVSMPSIPCVRYNPTVTVTPSGQWGSAGNSLSYTLSVRNNDTEGCAASNFTATPSLPTGFAQSPTNPTMTLNVGETKMVSFIVSAPLTATPASYVITQTVRNDASTSYTAAASTNFNIAAPDTGAPVITVTSPTEGQVLSGKKVTIAASATDQNGIAKLEVFINGKLVKTCSGTTSCSYAWSLTKVVAGSHVVKVVATDNAAQWNQSEKQITVTK